MTLKYLLPKAENKDLHVQFGATDCVATGMCAFIEKLIWHPYSHVHWDRSNDGLSKAAERTSKLLAIPGVLGVIDGLQLQSLTSRLEGIKSRFQGMDRRCQ